MKIVIVSDTHGVTDDFIKVYHTFKSEVDYFVHCGDVGFNIQECKELVHFKTVKGNCDLDDYPVMETIQLEDHTMLITHGHLLEVKWNLNRLYYTALEEQASIVCYGHTHQPLYTKMGDVIFINPGSLFANRGVRGKTFALLSIDDHETNVTHYDAKTFKPYKV